MNQRIFSNHPIARLCDKSRHRVIGLMSGTSVDGIDAALVEIEANRVDLIAFETIPFSVDERARILSLSDARTADLCQASFWIGERLAAAAAGVAQRARVPLSEVDIIGSHGQTVWHQPPSSCRSGEVASTLQIGEPAVIAARTGVVTVADFRVADVAVGGEGAPLVPFSDWLLFRQPGRRIALQNIGGIANVSVVGDRLDDTIAFDNGPGNMMIDALALAASGGADSIDRDGRYSAKGRVLEELLADLLADRYLSQPPPKSTGRERYGAQATGAWAAAHADRAAADLLATAVAFTAAAIADSYRRFVLDRGRIDEVLVSGGGAHNRTLMAELARRLDPLPVRRFEGDGGISADAKEAVAFALLAVRTILAEPANVPQVTGAKRPAVLGKICLP